MREARGTGRGTLFSSSCMRKAPSPYDEVSLETIVAQVVSYIARTEGEERVCFRRLNAASC